MKFPERLKQLRNEKGLYQKELADIIGVSRPTVTQYENGTRTPDQVTLQKIADFFNISLDYLLGRTDEPSPADKIKSAISDDPVLLSFWDELKEREDLQLMFKQTKNLSPSAIKQIIEIIKTFEKEEEERFNS